MTKVASPKSKNKRRGVKRVAIPLNPAVEDTAASQPQSVHLPFERPRRVLKELRRGHHNTVMIASVRRKKKAALEAALHAEIGSDLSELTESEDEVVRHPPAQFQDVAHRLADFKNAVSRNKRRVNIMARGGGDAGTDSKSPRVRPKKSHEADDGSRRNQSNDNENVPMDTRRQTDQWRPRSPEAPQRRQRSPEAETHHDERWSRRDKPSELDRSRSRGRDRSRRKERRRSRSRTRSRSRGREKKAPTTHYGGRRTYTAAPPPNAARSQAQANWRGRPNYYTRPPPLEPQTTVTPSNRKRDTTSSRLFDI